MNIRRHLLAKEKMLAVKGKNKQKGVDGG